MASVLDAVVEYDNGEMMEATRINPRSVSGAPTMGGRKVKKLVLTASLPGSGGRYRGEFAWSEDTERTQRAEAVAVEWLHNKCHLKSSCEGRVLNADVAGRKLCLFREE
jgi:hypothetical protein